MKKHPLALIFASWLPLAVLTLGVFFTLYAVAQQSYRQGANDPQIQIAEDATRALSLGAPPESVTPPGLVDIGKSLAPFTLVYLASLEPISGNGVLDNKIPKPPQGVFDFAKKYGEERVTWEPKPGVRVAAVVIHYNDSLHGSEGYVLAGRSLREVEIREAKLSLMIGIGLLMSLIATFLLVVFKVWYTEIYR